MSMFEKSVMVSFTADIVFLRTWYPVDVPQFFNPVTSLLLPPAEKLQWIGMKTVGQLRREKGLNVKKQKDSDYKVCNTLEALVQEHRLRMPTLSCSCF